MSTISHSPIECYTGHALAEFGELGETFSAISRECYPGTGRDAYLLYGPTGNGKSSCVGALHKVLAEHRWLVTWVDCAEWPTDFVDRDELVEELCASTTQILVLDDLGKEPKQCHRDVGRVIMSRSKLQRRLDFMTCNLNVSTTDGVACELTEVYGSAVRSRLFGMCRKNVICFNGPDHRLEVG